MYQLIRPKISVPVHGELRHLREHVALAKECQVPETVLVKNGAVVKLAPGPATIINEAPVGRFSAEGPRLHPLNSQVVKDRAKIIYNGTAVLTLALDKIGQIVGQPQLTTHALMDEFETEYILEILIDKIDNAFKKLNSEKMLNDEYLAEVARITVRRSFKETHDKRPLVTIHIVRL